MSLSGDGLDKGHMKNKRLGLQGFGLVLIMLLGGCKDVDELLTFTISDETTFTVESAGLLDLPVNIPTPDVTTNSNQKFENNNTSAALVKDIRLQTVRLTITNPTGETFDFLKSIHLYISTSSSNEIELASLDNIPVGVSTIELETTDERLDAYVKSSSYQVRTNVVTDEALSTDVDVKANIQFRVTAAPL